MIPLDNCQAFLKKCMDKEQNKIAYYLWWAVFIIVVLGLFIGWYYIGKFSVPTA